ncbi:MAG: hypothetical protein KZQ83_14885 [gamma proteobacterium symbiont of Taylorina sp.]|nr:hypothetical protein [gamma proteobacterium symbiont of Taylorina sp.]
MKKLWVLMPLLFSSLVLAQDFSLQLENKYDSVYESLSGVIVVSDDDCNVPDYTTVNLHYYGSPADLSAVAGVSYGLIDNFTYKVEEPVIIKYEACPPDIGACVEEPFFEAYIDYQNVTKKCNVYGVAKLRGLSQTVITSTSRSVYDATSQRLYLYDTEIYKNLLDTKTVISFVQLHFIDGQFELEVVE